MTMFYCSRLRFNGTRNRPIQYRQYLESETVLPCASVTHMMQNLFPDALILETRKVAWSDIPEGSTIMSATHN